MVYTEKGESAAMSELKDVIVKHYMREFSNFKGWQDVHRTDLIILLLRWISILEPELAAPIQRDYPVLSSLEVPGDQTVHAPVQQDEIPEITAEDDNVVFIESGPPATVSSETVSGEFISSGDEPQSPGSEETLDASEGAPSGEPRERHSSVSGIVSPVGYLGGVSAVSVARTARVARVIAFR